ncbi:MAG: GNAT family N-acetyltransferase [bacterium]|nr:GNAT family N-acetyltransferase [bacterium]
MTDTELVHTIIRHTELSPELAAEIEDHYQQTFAFEINRIKEWTVAEWMLISYVGDEWVSLIELSKREITVGGLPLLVGGIGGVYTPEQHRGKGYAHAALRRAMAFLCEEQRVAFAMLLCGDHRVSLYQGLGWQVVGNPARYQQTTGDDVLPPEFNVMVYSCGNQPWPEGEIDFRGRPW